jgi:splicing factor 1
MNELSGNPAGNGDMPPQRIEAGPGTYDQGDSFGGERDLKPWQRQPTGGAAPWQRERSDRPRDDYGSRDQGASSARPWASGGRDHDNYGGGYGGAPGGGGGGGPAPWQQAPPPAPPGGPPAYGYGGYPGSGYDSGYGAPPGAAPPGLGSYMHQYGGGPPPPPPGDAPPPPPPSGDAPPPPPADYPPPPPPQ